MLPTYAFYLCIASAIPVKENIMKKPRKENIKKRR